MKKIFWVVVIGFFVYVGVVIVRALPSKSVQAAAFASTNTQYATPTFRSTETPVPTATIGYEATIFVAQATADEARRVNAQATAAHEANQLAQMQLTADAEKRAQEVLSWTAQAGPTIIPLTATQQVVMNTQVAIGEMRVAAMMTMTKEAPTQISAMARSQSAVEFARLAQIADVTGKYVLIVFVLILSIFIITRLKMPNLISSASEEKQTETVVQIRRDNGQGSFAQTRAVVPCSPEQLTELAEYAINGEKKFGINRLENTSRTFHNQRETLILVRQFLVENKFVIPDNNGTITLNADGEAFLTGWFDSHRLPSAYEFAEPKESDPELQEELQETEAL